MFLVFIQEHLKFLRLKFKCSKSTNNYFNCVSLTTVFSFRYTIGQPHVCFVCACGRRQKSKNSDLMPESHPRDGLIVLGVAWASEFQKALLVILTHRQS